MTPVLIIKGPCFGGLTFKNRGQLGSRYIFIYTQIIYKKGIISTILFWLWDLDHQSYSREGSGFLGFLGKRFQTYSRK